MPFSIFQNKKLKLFPVEMQRNKPTLRNGQVLLKLGYWLLGDTAKCFLFFVFVWFFSSCYETLQRVAGSKSNSSVTQWVNSCSSQWSYSRGKEMTGMGAIVLYCTVLYSRLENTWSGKQTKQLEFESPGKHKAALSSLSAHKLQSTSPAAQPWVLFKYLD